MPDKHVPKLSIVPFATNPQLNPVFCIVLIALASFGGCSQLSERVAMEGLTYYPAEPAPTRIVAMGPIGKFLSAGQAPSPLRRFITGEKENDYRIGLIRPLSIAVRDGQLLVCDVGLEAVVRIDPIAGTIQLLINASQPQPAKPVAVTVDLAGNALVADVAGGVILSVASDGSINKRYKLPDSQEKFKPIAVAASARKLYAINRASRSIELFDLESGQYLGPLITRNNSDSDLIYPVALAVTASGQIYVVDTLKCKVQIYDSEGNLTDSIGKAGDRAGQFARPRSVAIGPNGIIYVSDAATQVVQMFDPTGQPLMSFGGADSAPGSMTLPAGLCMDRSLIKHFATKLPKNFMPEYLIFVANQLGPGRLGVYAFGQFGPGQ